MEQDFKDIVFSEIIRRAVEIAEVDVRTREVNPLPQIKVADTGHGCVVIYDADSLTVLAWFRVVSEDLFTKHFTVGIRGIVKFTFTCDIRSDVHNLVTTAVPVLANTILLSLGLE